MKTDGTGRVGRFTKTVYVSCPFSILGGSRGPDPFENGYKINRNHSFIYDRNFLFLVSFEGVNLL